MKNYQQVPTKNKYAYMFIYSSQDYNIIVVLTNMKNKGCAAAAQPFPSGIPINNYLNRNLWSACSNLRECLNFLIHILSKCILECSDVSSNSLSFIQSDRGIPGILL